MTPMKSLGFSDQVISLPKYVTVRHYWALK
jgi:hypothetical protein